MKKFFIILLVFIFFHSILTIAKDNSNTTACWQLYQMEEMEMEEGLWEWGIALSLWPKNEKIEGLVTLTCEGFGSPVRLLIENVKHDSKTGAISFQTAFAKKETGSFLNPTKNGGHQTFFNGTLSKENNNITGKLSGSTCGKPSPKTEIKWHSPCPKYASSQYEFFVELLIDGKTWKQY